jgi:hypothetical protein
MAQDGGMDFLAAPPPASVAGIITASSTLLIAFGGILTALTVLVPILRRTKENTKAITEGQRVTSAKLEVIHTLVNSTLTAALQSELDSTRREELLLRELMQMRSDAGHPVTDDQRATLGATQRKIRELARAMDDRIRQTRSADIQIEVERDRKA